METLPDRLPMVIGVTGHRDLRDEDVPRLEREIAAIIGGLRRDYLGGDQETPIIVLSALAEGADRLVAKVALAEGARLIVPLPMPIEEYRRDFEPGLKPGNMAEFDALLAQAIAAPVMPLHASLEAIRADGKKRAEQYRAVGIFITQHCHVLLALWDGDDQDMAAGGTAEVVTFKRDGIPLMVSGSPRASLDASEVGPVIEIVTPRMKEGSSAKEVAVRPWGRAVITSYRGGIAQRSFRRVGEFFAHLLRREPEDERSKLSPHDRRELATWESFEALIDLTVKFNRDAAALERTADGATRLTQSIDYLFTDPGAAAADSDAKGRAMHVAPLWCRLYALADTLALERQSEFKRDWKVLFGVGFTAFFCFAMFTHAGYLAYALFLIAYLLAFVIGVFVYVRAAHRQDQERYLDYRALAEALRVAVYWKLLGVGSRYLDAKLDSRPQEHTDINPIGLIANAYPIKQPSELAWVKICLRSLERLDKSEGGLEHRIDPAGHDIARRFWVHGQFAYFRRQGYRHNSFAEYLQAWSDILILLSAFVLVPILIYMRLSGIDHHWHVAGVEVGLQHVLLIVVGLLPIVAAVLTGYSERLAFKAQARQYDRMRMLFERAYDLLPAEIDDRTTGLAHALYQELGMEAMKENAEWVAIYRQRPIEPLRG
jgi:Ca2+/Na+ antiporter